MARAKRITKKILFAKTIEILQPKLNLGDWRIIVRYSRNMKSAIADCVAEPEYKQATIRLSLNRLPEYSNYEIVSTAVHEMMHCIVWPLSQLAHDYCKKDIHKIEMTRRMDETVITHLERTFTDMAFPLLQEELTKMGYQDIEATFENLQVLTEKKPSQKRSNKNKKR